MEKFVTRGQAHSPQSGPNPERNRKAQHARVQPGALKNRQPEQQNSSARRQSGSTVNPQAVLQNPSQRRSGESQAHPDRYDTDAESLDTTTHGQSVMKFEDSQGSQRPKPIGIKHDDEYGGSEENSESETQPELPTYYFHDLVETQNLQHMSRDAQVNFLRHEGFRWFEDGNSYPTTTSGLPDDFPDNWTIGEETPSDGNGRVSSPSLVQRPIYRPPAPQASQRIHKREPQVNQPGNNVPKQTNYFQEGAALRQGERATNLTVRGGASYHQNTDLSTARQPPTYGQANQDPHAQMEVATQFRQSAQHLDLKHAGFQPPSRPLPTQPATQAFPAPRTSAQAAAHVVHPAQAVHKVETVVQPKPVTPDLSGRKPIEDYDASDLFEKKYDELKAEDFDTVPRGKRQVLSENMTQRLLADRLVHVQKNLNHGDQDDFFRSLSTREWEEAGDWFLDQFSAIITCTKEARQRKRKLASEFEDEVEKRYRQVAKRQQNVNSALDKMKQQGEGLVPKSPRPTKTPKKR